MIDAAALQWHISADRLKTLPPEQLTPAADILNVSEAIIVLVRAFSEGSPRDAEPRILSHLRYQKLEMVLFKRDIGVKVPDNVEIQVLHPVIPGVEGMNFPCEVPFATFWHPDQFDPGSVRHVLADDFVGAIGGTIADDHPFERRDSLGHHRFEGQYDEFRLVARGSDKDVSWERRHGGHSCRATSGPRATPAVERRTNLLGTKSLRWGSNNGICPLWSKD